MKKALITGITGQDGSYLAELLLQKGYEVYGMIRKASSFNTQRIEHIRKDIIGVYGDMTDSSCINRLIIDKIRPDEIYNLAAQSHVQVSFEIPEYTGEVSGFSVIKILDAIKDTNTKFYQASTSEMFGKVYEIPQKETTPFYPRSPYAAAKVYAYWITVNYREAYNIFGVNGILFNHESERRQQTFITRKITTGISKILSGEEEFLIVGNLYSKRDWGYAPDYCKGMYLMMQHSKPDDYILATGETHTIKEFIELAFQYVGINIKWSGKGLSEFGYNPVDNRILVKVDERYFRPTEVDLLLGDATKAKQVLGWTPKVKFEELVTLMMKHDCK